MSVGTQKISAGTGAPSRVVRENGCHRVFGPQPVHARPARPHESVASHRTRKNRRFSTSTKSMDVDVEPTKTNPPKKQGGASDPAGASCHGSAGQGQGDRTPGVSQRPHLMYGYWRAVGTVRRGSIEMQMACQSWQRRRLLTRWGTGEGAGRAFGCFFQPSARQTQPPLALPLGPTDTRGGAIDRPLL